MVRSMTGYGRGEYEGATGSYLVEVASTNHRYLELKARLPRGWTAFEPRVREVITRRFRRGHFDLFLVERADGTRGEPVLDWGLAERYLEGIRQLKKRFRLPGRIDIQLLAGARELFQSRDSLITEECWEEMRKALDSALDGLEEMRNREGRALEEQIREGLETMWGLLGSIRSRWPRARDEHQQRIRERIEQMMEGSSLDGLRLEQELSLWAERWDITEECIRLESHLRRAQEFLDQDPPCGRPLDFLFQEMHREANTISSKASDAMISHQVIEFKTELEKLREQVQNVE